ncbi:MAG: multidrug efflux pump subunit AcrB [Gammaproteobacteria bacterium]|jgi:multidrug efflux pump subunit AcrB
MSSSQPTSEVETEATPDTGETRGVFALLVGHPIALSVMFTTLIVVGIIGYMRIPLQLLPSGFAEPRLNIYVIHPDSSAEENEEQIARVIEEQLRTLTGIEQIYSNSSDGAVMMRVSFSGDQDMDLAKAEVRDRVERARPLLPSTAENPAMWTESASTLPISFFGIQVRGEESERDYLMEKVIIPRLEGVPGVGKVDMWGVLQDSVRILLDEEKVAAAGLDVGGLIRRLSSDNFALPLGQVNDGGREILLRTDMRFTGIEEIANYPLGDGIVVGDLGRVSRVKSVSNSLSRIDGGFAYYGMASKDSQANVVDVSRAWTETLEELEADPRLAGKMSSMVFFLQGDMIEGALGQLRETAAWGGALALLVLFVFLKRFRLTLCVALSIPVSVLLALLWEYAWGGSFNILTMTGVTLAIGMLVDNAVVVVENISREHLAGRSGKDAAVLGTRQIALAVTLATLTTVVVFMPIIFLGSDGVLRTMFAAIGIPFSISLLASLIVAVVFLPVVTARLLGNRPAFLERIGEIIAPVVAIPARVVGLLVGGMRWVFFRYMLLQRRVLSVALRGLTILRYPLAAGAIGLTYWQIRNTLESYAPGDALAEFGQPIGLPVGMRTIAVPASLGLACIVVVGLLVFGLPRWKRRLPETLLPPASYVPKSPTLIDMAIGMNQLLLQWTLKHRLMATFLAVLAFLSILIPMSAVELTPFGSDASNDSIDFRVEYNANLLLGEALDEAMVYEEFLETKRDEWGFAHWSSRVDNSDVRFTLHWEELREKEEADATLRDLRAEVPQISGHTLKFYDGDDAGSTSREFAFFSIQGPEARELEALGQEAVRILKGVPGILEVSTSLEDAPDQISVQIDRDLAQGFEVTADTIQQSISWVLRGFPLPRFQEGGRDVPFLIEFDSEEIAGIPTLRDLSVFRPGGDSVPLSSFANLGFEKASRSIERRDGRITFPLIAKVEDPIRILAITRAGEEALATGLTLPRGFSLGSEDSAIRRQQQETSQLMQAMWLGVVLVFLLMAVLFESLLLPFSVLFTVPFAVAGAWWTLLITGIPMDTVGWIGMIILAGVVVNNGIVLIDRIHCLRATGIARAAAVIQGCAQRVRPVMMTALTTVCGLFPMIIAPAPPGDAIDYRALATIVAGGLIASTVFTLWVVPLAYTVLDDFPAVIKAHGRWWLSIPRRFKFRRDLPVKAAEVAG